MRCPRSVFAGAAPSAADPSEQPGATDYRSAFGAWHGRAAVRVRPRRVLSDDDDGDYYFSPDLVPIATHPVVRNGPPAVLGEILTQHLYRYLDFTTKLECLVVNHTVLGIAMGTSGVPMPEAMRHDAFKIYCDEGYHAMFSVDLATQVRARTGMRPRVPIEPYFIRRLRAILDPLPANRAALAELLFVIVSETLISASLADIPEDRSVVGAVRDVTRDHALDEGRHHAYFAQFLKLLWGALDQAERMAAALLVPSLIDAFLGPDVDSVREDLQFHRFHQDTIEHVVAEAYDPALVHEQIRGTARQLVHYLAELDVFEVNEVVNEFARFSLLR